MDTTPRRPRGKTRELVRRHYAKGETIRDIATRLDISVQAVSDHVHNLVADGELKARRPA